MSLSQSLTENSKFEQILFCVLSSRPFSSDNENQSLTVAGFIRYLAANGVSSKVFLFTTEILQCLEVKNQINLTWSCFKFDPIYIDTSCRKKNGKHKGSSS